MSDPLRNIRVSSYVNSSSSNYGLNSLCVELGEIDLYFSYQTVVAYRAPGEGLVVCENVWSNTTGKHLNAIDGGNKSGRLKHDRFESQLARLLKKHKLITPRVS